MKKSSSKVKTLDEILRLLPALRKAGKVIVTTNGSYDLLHAGHLLSLEESKSQGDVLIVGVNSDSSVKAYKSPLRPIIPEQERTLLLAGLECVDYVFIFNQLTPNDWLRKICPDIHTNFIGYGVDCVEALTLKEIGAKLYLCQEHAGLSTTAILDRVVDIFKREGRLK